MERSHGIPCKGGFLETVPKQADLMVEVKTEEDGVGFSSCRTLISHLWGKKHFASPIKQLFNSLNYFSLSAVSFAVRFHNMQDPADRM